MLRQRVAVEGGGDRPGFAGNVEEDRCDRSAEERTPIDAREQDDCGGGAAGLLRHRESEGEQDGNAVRTAQAGQHADDDSQDDADEHQQQVERGQRDPDPLQQRVDFLHSASLSRRGLRPANPPAQRSIESQCSLERPFGKRHREPYFEDQKKRNADAYRDRRDLDPGVLAQVPHEVGDIERGRDVETQIPDHRDIHDRRHENRQYFLQLLARHERFGCERRISQGTDQDRCAGGADEQADIKGKIAGLRPVVSPSGTQAVAVEYDEGAEEKYEDGDTDFHRPDRCRRMLLLAFHPLLDPPVPQSGVLDARYLRARPILPRQEARFLHEHDVPRLLARHPGFVFLPGQGGLVERALLQKALPIGGFPHLLQQVDVVLFLLVGHTTGHENAAQHQVLDVEPGILARGNVVPGHRLGDLCLVGHAFGVEHAQGAQRSGAPLRHRFDRVVDRRIDVLANQLYRNLAAAAIRNVDELGSGLFLDSDGDDLILLLRARATHLELSAAGLDRGKVFLGRLVGRLRVDPKDEVVQGHHLYRRQIAPIERRIGRKGGRKQIRQGDDELVRVAFRLLDVQEALGTRASGLVDDDHRLLHQLVLGNDALNDPRHLIGAPAGAGGNDELHRPSGLPGRKRLNGYGCPRGEQRERRGLTPRTIGKVAHFSSSCCQDTKRNGPPSIPAVPSISCNPLFARRLSPQAPYATLTEVKAAPRTQVSRGGEVRPASHFPATTTDPAPIR